jgi:D-sedoheptulose 7-phosphate isomerase
VTQPAAIAGALERQAPRVAALCRAMAERFAGGGRLLATGTTAAERTDAHHVAVEFVHPVIVGKRALPALALAPEAVAALAGPDDVVARFGGGGVRFALGDEAWDFPAPVADPFAAQELTETLYHVVWELVHVFFEHRGMGGRDAGASGFLYPWMAAGATDLDAVLADVEASVVAKAREAAELRAATLAGAAGTLRAAAAGLRDRLDAGGTVLALGHGGSATDAADAVADLREPPAGMPRRRAIDLAADPAILTAIANDIGADAMFSRQVIALAHPGDVLLAFSTSGRSRGALTALEQARRRDVLTVAFVGYDGGTILSEGLADHVVVAPSEHIPRIQEAHATAWHALRRGLEAA